jgi:hypothetical protein
VSKPAKVLHGLIFFLMGAAAAAFVLLAVLAAAGLTDPRYAAAAFGIVFLAVGADGVAGALVADWPRVGWKPPPGRPTFPAGRLSSLGFGLTIGSVGMLLIGNDQVPQSARLVVLVGFAAGFVLTLVGQSYDWRRAEARSYP